MREDIIKMKQYFLTCTSALDAKLLRKVGFSNVPSNFSPRNLAFLIDFWLSFSHEESVVVLSRLLSFCALQVFLSAFLFFTRLKPSSRELSYSRIRLIRPLKEIKREELNDLTNEANR